MCGSVYPPYWSIQEANCPPNSVNLHHPHTASQSLCTDDVSQTLRPAPPPSPQGQIHLRGSGLIIHALSREQMSISRQVEPMFLSTETFLTTCLHRLNCMWKERVCGVELALRGIERVKEGLFAVRTSTCHLFSSCPLSVIAMYNPSFILTTYCSIEPSLAWGEVPLFLLEQYNEIMKGTHQEKWILLANVNLM